MRFESAVVLNGKTATGIPVPPEVVEALGGGKRIKVVVTIGDHAYRNSVVSWGEGFMLSFGAEHRAATGLEAGDPVTLDLVRDEAERTVESRRRIRRRTGGQRRCTGVLRRAVLLPEAMVHPGAGRGQEARDPGPAHREVRRMLAEGRAR